MMLVIVEFKTTHFACKNRCVSQFCPDCSMSHCVAWREKLRDGIKHWRSVIMLTMTIDPKQHRDPESAFRLVQQKRRVAEMIRKLHRDGVLRTKEYTLTIEFHKNGWPHYHVLVEATFVCKHKLQESWKMGVCWVSKHDFEGINHAINYATKYIVKTDANDGFAFPGWVLDYDGLIRRFSTSRGLCRTRDQRNRKKNTDPKKTKRRTARDRQKQCGKTTKIIRQTTAVLCVETDSGPVEVEKKRYRLEGILRLGWEEAEKKDQDLLVGLFRVQEWNDKQTAVECGSHLDAAIEATVGKQQVKVLRHAERLRVGHRKSSGCH